MSEESARGILIAGDYDTLGGVLSQREESGAHTQRETYLLREVKPRRSEEGGAKEKLHELHSPKNLVVYVGRDNNTTSARRRHLL